MFKRVQKANAEHEKRIKKGEVEEGEGPRELMMNMDSDSSSSGSDSESESESSSAGSSSEESVKQTKKRKHEEEESEDEESSEEEEDSSEEEEEESSDDESSDEEEEEGSKTVKPPSIEKAMEDPIHIKPNAIVRQGFEHRSCYLCPGVLIKTETMINTHLKSGSHTRSKKRFTKMIEKLKPEEGKELTILDISDRVEKQLAKQIETQKRVKENNTKAKLEARKKRKAIKKVNREARKAEKAKAEKEAPDGKKGKKQVKSNNQIIKKVEDGTPKKPTSLAQEIIQQKIDQHKLIEKDPRKLTKKYIKSKVLTKGEKEELRRIKNQERSTKQFEQREAKRARKAEKLAAKSSEIS